MYSFTSLAFLNFFILFVFLVWYGMEYIPRKDMQNKFENTSVQLVLVDNRYYFPPANNHYLSPLLQNSPDIVKQKCLKNDYNNVILVYDNGIGLSLKNDYESYVHDFWQVHKIYKHWFLPAELFKRKFSHFCSAHFPK